MGHCISRCGKEDDIISEKSLEALKEIVRSLQTNIEDMGNGWAFRADAVIQNEMVKTLVAALNKGSTNVVIRLLEDGWRLEAAQALYIFVANLKQPMIPEFIQALVLDDNSNVMPEVVATDVLGLLKQEITTRHFHLLCYILWLLHTIMKFSPSDELRGTTLPLSMLPVFFNIQRINMSEWRRVATIYVELMRQSEMVFTSVIAEAV